MAVAHGNCGSVSSSSASWKEEFERRSHELLFVSLVAVLHQSRPVLAFCHGVEISLVSLRTLCGFQRRSVHSVRVFYLRLVVCSEDSVASSVTVCSRCLRLCLHLAGCVSRLVRLSQVCCRLGQHTLVLGALSSTFLSLRYQFLKLIIN